MNRVAVGNTVYHTLNRSNERVQVFHTDKDYKHFESLLLEGVELVSMRILSNCVIHTLMNNVNCYVRNPTHPPKYGFEYGYKYYVLIVFRKNIWL